jgi:hypothetical protein
MAAPILDASRVVARRRAVFAVAVEEKPAADS